MVGVIDGVTLMVGVTEIVRVTVGVILGVGVGNITVSHSSKFSQLIKLL